MKRAILLSAILVQFCFVALTAQQNSFFIGANAGANLSKFKFTEDLKELYPTTNSKLLLNGGFTMGLEIEDFVLRTGLEYVQKGSDYQTENFVDEFGTGYFTAKEKQHFVSVPLMLEYRSYVDYNFAFTIGMGPVLNFGVNGKLDELTEYFGTDDVDLQHYKVAFGKGVNDDYKNSMVSFRITPGMLFKIDERNKLTFNVAWDLGMGDSFNPRYKDANDFFVDYTGNQINRSTMFTVGYEYHFNFGDKY